MTGSWDVNVTVGKMPQKVATACVEINETIIGASYEPIAYLGSQVVNGENHAVLAKQTVLTGKDTENIVLLIFNIKPNEDKATLVAIDRVLESGGEFGGIKINATTDIPSEAQEALDNVLEGFVGCDINAFAFLGTQVTKGTDYIFAAEVTPVVKDPVNTVAIVAANPMNKNITINDILTSKDSIGKLGYAFTWLR